jgi:hypothetical protein
MKKFKLRPFNKNVLKAVAVTAAVATIGGHIIADHVKNVKHNQAVNTFKEELVDYKTKNDVYEMDKTTETADMETIDIYNKIPRIAIIYHDNGKISFVSCSQSPFLFPADYLPISFQYLHCIMQQSLSIKKHPVSRHLSPIWKSYGR